MNQTERGIKKQAKTEITPHLKTLKESRNGKWLVENLILNDKRTSYMWDLLKREIGSQVGQHSYENEKVYISSIRSQVERVIEEVMVSALKILGREPDEFDKAELDTTKEILTTVFTNEYILNAILDSD